MGADGKIKKEKIEDEKKVKRMKQQAEKTKLYAVVMGIAVSAATVWW
jgi:hypothetical protein